MFKSNPPPIDVTIVLFDGEDMGKEGIHNSYASGSKYFAENLLLKNPIME